MNEVNDSLQRQKKSKTKIKINLKFKVYSEEKKANFDDKVSV